MTGGGQSGSALRRDIVACHDAGPHRLEPRPAADDDLQLLTSSVI